MADGSVTPQDFAVSVLQGLQAPVTPQNVQALVGWQQAEGGHWNNAATYNPLNTTQNGPGARSINGVGVKAYGSWQQGLAATLQTLRNGNYGGILQALHQGNDPAAVARAIGQSPWGTDASLVAQTIARAPQVKGGAIMSSPSATSTPAGQTFDQAGFNQATQKYNALTAFKAANRSNPFDVGPKVAGLSGGDPVLAMLRPSQPNPQDFIRAQSGLQGIAGGTVLSAHPAVQGATQTSNIAAGFLPKGATYVQGRKDQGRDGQTNPGGPILANGNGKVIAVKSDPAGFGPSYPLVHFSSGPFAGRTLYFGHTLSQVQPGQTVKAGQVISRTGTSGVGNATVPGWFEIGFADSGTPGPMGQAVPF